MPGHRRHLTSLRRWDTDFDGGGAASIVDEGGKIRITPRFDWNSQWLWFAMRSDRLAGQTPHFLIAKADRFATYGAAENVAVWSTSPDTDTWYKFDNQSVGASDAEFYNNAPFPNGTIYIAYLPLYPYSRYMRLYHSWLKDTRVSVVSIGQDTRRASAEGRSAPGLPILGLSVENSNANTKNVMVLTAGNHPTENTGPYQLEGAMTWLLGGSVLAEFVLDWFKVYVMMPLNPQGVWGGYFRSSPQTPTDDNNRLWDSTGTNAAVDLVKAALPADIEVGIDFHSSADGGDGYMASDDHTATLYAAFLAEMQALDAGYGYSDAVVATTLHALWNGSYSAALGLTCEYGALNTKGIADWKTQGAYALQSVGNMHADGRWTNGPGVGSRDFNGTTDRVDWSNISNFSGSPFTISAWINWDGQNGGNNSYILCMHDSSDSVYGIIFNIVTGVPGDIDLVIHGAASDYVWNRISGDQIQTGAWTNVIVTRDGGLLSGSVAFYINGGSVSISFTNGSGGETDHTGSWSLGGRIYNDTRNLDGKIAQVGVWSRVLGATEIANLAAGYAPDLAAPTDLEFYFKGNTASLDDEVTSGEGTADGTTSVTGVGNGPGIIYG